MKLTIRPAIHEDAPFVAWTVLTAVGIENPDKKILSSVTKMCSRDELLYSWRNTLIAENDGKPVGSLTCYDGAKYLKMRKITFPLIRQNSGQDFSDSDMETGLGEFYLDSMSVLPEYRHKGIATALLKAGIDKAKSIGLSKVAMIVSPENTSARRLYESLGFRFSHQLFAFKENYLKMVKEI